MWHVVWDWNGTLFDDQHIVLDGVNAVMADLGAPAVTVEKYQELYTRPVQLFYERLLGRSLTDDEWERLDDVYHDTYHARLPHAALSTDARDALDRVHHQRHSTQSLLSMWRHDPLMRLIEEYDLTGYFARVDGLRGAGGGRKAGYLRAHLDELREAGVTDISDERIVVIGDALDDAAAAAEVGVPCVLYDGGSHPRGELEAAGVPVVESLVGALATAGVVAES